MVGLRKHETPEAAHLAEQERLLADLADQLATTETDFATTVAEFDAFRLRYLRRLAPLYAELDRLEAELARRLAEREGTVQAQARATEAAARAEESAYAADSATGLTDAESARPSPPPELRDLYRQAAKMIHPDLSTDDEERDRRTKLMAALNAAYAVGDAEVITRMIDSEAARPEAIIGDDVASNLVRVIRKLAQVRSRLAELAQMSAILQGDPVFVLLVQCREQGISGLDPLADDEARLMARIADHRARLAAFEVDMKRPLPADR